MLCWAWFVFSWIKVFLHPRLRANTKEWQNINIEIALNINSKSTTFKIPGMFISSCQSASVCMCACIWDQCDLTSLHCKKLCWLCIIMFLLLLHHQLCYYAKHFRRLFLLTISIKYALQIMVVYVYLNIQTVKVFLSLYQRTTDRHAAASCMSCHLQYKSSPLSSLGERMFQNKLPI